MIRAEALTRTYGDFTAVDQVSFEIGAGEIVGLLGHNGAGKTTIMKMLAGYLEPTAGRIEIDGLDMAEAPRAIQARLGYLPENDPLYPEMTVIDYLDYAATLHGVPVRERPRRICEAIDKTELGPKATQPIATLSRGYRQRVGVAQAILHRPRLLILDEPTNGLDPTQVQHMRSLIRACAEEATVILSTHILQEVQAVCSRVIIIRNGRKALDAGLDELREGRRLLVALDAGPRQAMEPLRAIEGVTQVELLDDAGGTHRYALRFSGDAEPLEAAPRVAQRVAGEGWKLYTLQPERRDLETVFAEISAQ